jgi:hypothetical protein
MIAIPGFQSWRSAIMRGFAPRRIAMSAQIVLLPVFVLVGLTFAFFLVGTRRGSLAGDETKARDMALGQSDLPLFFYVLIALALPLRHADLVIVLLSWVFVVTCFARTGIFVTSNDVRQGSLAWLAGALVLFAMWLYFALRILLLI